MKQSVTRKLFNLKEWLTVACAAQHLTILFAEEVTEADVLRLVLDGQLKLSVHFVNHATARRGMVVPIAEAKFKKLPSFDGAGTVQIYGGPTVFTKGVVSHIVELEPAVVTLAGVFDLPMMGGEELDIEHEYQRLTDGPPVTLVGMNGAFVEGRDGQVFQLQDSFDDNEYQSGSNAQLKKLKQHIEDRNIGAAEAEGLLNRYKEDRKDFLKKRASQSKEDNYYPAGGLPEDSVLVVRTQALRDFEETLRKSEEATNNTPAYRTDTERTNLLKQIGALALALAEVSKKYKIGEKPNAKQIAEKIGDILGSLPDTDKRGMGDSSIRGSIQEGLALFKE